MRRPSFESAVCGNGGRAVFETASSAFLDSVAYCVDRMMSRSASKVEEILPERLLRESNAPNGSTKRAWNRLLNGGSRGYPGYGGTGAAMAMTLKFLCAGMKTFLCLVLVLLDTSSCIYR